jgi:serine protease Do
LPVDHGVLITKVAEYSPAENVGMKKGDIILQIENVETRTIQDLAQEIHKRKVGDKVRVFGLSSNKEHFFDLKLRSIP